MTVKQYILWLSGLTRGVRLRLLARVASGVLRVAVLMAFVLVCKQMVDVAVGSARGSLPLLAAAMAGCIVTQLCLGAVVSRLSVLVSAEASNRLRSEMFSRAMHALYGRGLHSSDVMERMRKDAETVTDLSCGAIPDVVVTAVQFAAAFSLLAMLDWRLAAVMTAIMPVALLAGRSFYRRMHRMSRQIRSLESSIHTHTQEHLRLRHLDAALSSRGRAVSRLDALQWRLLRLVKRRNCRSLQSRTIIQAGFAAGYATAFLWGVAGLSTGAVSFGVMTAFLQLVSQVQRPAVDLARRFPAFVYGMASAERVRRVLDAAVEEPAGVSECLEAPVGLRFDDVSFAYSADAPDVISSLTHDFRPGTVTAITGATGIGKTTLLRLALGLVTPRRGRIAFYNGSRSAEASPATRCNVAFVPQGNTLLSGTIRSNLRLADPDATDRDMREALEMACAGFVFDLPAGLDTPCGESAKSFSEGQAQRIAIARGLLVKAPVMLLDEPTSALDPATERRLLANFRALAPSRTIIIITHREAAASICTATLRL